MTEEEAVKKLKKMIDPDRLEHSLAVRDSAVKLAKKYEVDPEKARWAALLHDCARNISNNHLLKKAEEFGIVVDRVFSKEPVLLHAPVGAKVAQIEFGIEDEEILQAIKVHTLGSRNMSKLDKVIFLADHIEPNREGKEIDKLRLHIKTDTEGKSLDNAVKTACEDIIRYHLDLGEIIHPQTVAARNSLL